IDSFCEVPNMHPDQTKGKEAQRKIRVEVNRTLRLRERLRMHVLIQVPPAKGIVAVWIAVIERDRTRRGRIDLRYLLVDIVAPPVPDPGVQCAGQPHMRLGKV